MKKEKLSMKLKAISQNTRLEILILLRDRILCVNALSVLLGITQGAVSQHLRVLCEAGLVYPDKKGRYVHYRLKENEFKKIIKGLDKFSNSNKISPCPFRKDKTQTNERKKNSD
jgi:ArsR family transcriptional regulator, arsenate/arsenite/antimonite-responsive transcriptional repressor